MKTQKSSWQKKTAAILMLMSFLGIQVSGAVHICLCASAPQNVQAQADLPPCHAAAPATETPPDTHNHSDCDCQIQAPDDPQLMDHLSHFAISGAAWFPVSNIQAKHPALASHKAHTRAQNMGSPPLYQRLQHYLI